VRSLHRTAWRAAGVSRARLFGLLGRWEPPLGRWRPSRWSGFLRRACGVQGEPCGGALRAPFWPWSEWQPFGPAGDVGLLPEGACADADGGWWEVVSAAPAPGGVDGDAVKVCDFGDPDQFVCVHWLRLSRADRRNSVDRIYVMVSRQ
jgi:hypothetical protein